MGGDILQNFFDWGRNDRYGSRNLDDYPDEYRRDRRFMGNNDSRYENDNSSYGGYGMDRYSYDNRGRDYNFFGRKNEGPRTIIDDLSKYSLQVAILFIVIAPLIRK